MAKSFFVSIRIALLFLPNPSMQQLHNTSVAAPVVKQCTSQTHQLKAFLHYIKNICSICSNRNIGDAPFTCIKIFYISLVWSSCFIQFQTERTFLLSIEEDWQFLFIHHGTENEYVYCAIWKDDTLKPNYWACHCHVKGRWPI